VGAALQVGQALCGSIAHVVRHSVLAEQVRLSSGEALDHRQLPGSADLLHRLQDREPKLDLASVRGARKQLRQIAIAGVSGGDRELSQQNGPFGIPQ
jgi:hypothetical protein